MGLFGFVFALFGIIDGCALGTIQKVQNSRQKST